MHSLNEGHGLVDSVAPPFHTPAFLPGYATLLQVRELPQMVHYVSFSRNTRLDWLHEAGTYLC